MPSGALEPVPSYSSASPSYRLPDTFPQSLLPITVLVMTLLAAGDKIPNSNKLKKRKKGFLCSQTEDSQGYHCFRHSLIHTAQDLPGMEHLPLTSQP